MLKKLIPAVLGLIVCVQTSSSFAGGSFFPHHHHHGHHHHHFNHGRFFIQPFPFAVQQQQYALVKKWTPYGWVYVKQPIGLVRF
jgi:hypothetical protein